VNGLPEWQRRSFLGKRSVRFRGVLEVSRNRLWGAHIGVPAAAAKQVSQGASRRVLCRLENGLEYQTALMPNGKGAFVIRVNRKIRQELRLEFGRPVDVVLTPDQSRYGLPMPEELDVILHQDPEGNRHFRALTLGRQRTLLHLVGSAKKSETRVRRAVAVVRHLKTNHGKIDFRQLRELMR